MKRKQEIDKKTWRLVRKIARNIRRVREERKLTQEDMENHGFGPRWYQRFESGKHILTLPTLDKLARAFKVDITEFFK
ncbi:MAG: helix-turn-helix transcriptional regulator [Bdellovibrionales bacterium]|nr:helix-turn-helix transcriptional regulator [Bdellovibrionales bacterium]